MTPPEWLQHAERTVKHWRDRGLGPGWVVAVSGGSDSVGLLRALTALAPGLGLELSVAHLDHGVRGEAARADAAFVAELAAALGLPFDLGQWSPERPAHFEAEARRARYAWLTEVARARGASAVAVGHTRDDQAETILHRILRGTGLRGLAGIPPRRVLDPEKKVTLVRPLLHVTRDELRAYLTALGQPYREDASNADTSRTRARIRHELLPGLARDYNPRVADALVRLGNIASAAERAREAGVRALEREVVISRKADQVMLRRQRFADLSRYQRIEVLRRIWRRLGWPERGMTAGRWQRLASLTGSHGGRGSLEGGITIASDDLFLLLWRTPTPETPEPAALSPSPEPLALAVPGEVAWNGARVVATLDPDAPRDETVDLDRIEGPLQVRRPVAGDRFAPLGMGGQSTPLNDFFRGRGVPLKDRVRVPLVCDTRGIVWVAGHRIAHRVRRTENTRNTLGLRFEREPRGV